MTDHRPRTWFLTGASRGLGAQWARAVLERGDRLAATARDATSLKPLVDAHGDQVLPLGFDVADATAQARKDDAYTHARQALFAGAAHIVPGDVAASGRAVLELADAAEPPLRVLFGIGGLDEVREEYASRLDGWQKWDSLSRAAHGSTADAADGS